MREFLSEKAIRRIILGIAILLVLGASFLAWDYKQRQKSANTSTEEKAVGNREYPAVDLTKWSTAQINEALKKMGTPTDQLDQTSREIIDEFLRQRKEQIKQYEDAAQGDPNAIPYDSTFYIKSSDSNSTAKPTSFRPDKAHALSVAAPIIYNDLTDPIPDSVRTAVETAYTKLQGVEGIAIGTSYIELLYMPGSSPYMTCPSTAIACTLHSAVMPGEVDSVSFVTINKDKYESYPADVQEYILIHELSHAARGSYWVNDILWEEGLAVMAGYAVNPSMVSSQSIINTTSSHPGAQNLAYGSARLELLSNQELGDHSYTMPGSFLYELGSAALAKFYISDRDFLRKFQQGLVSAGANTYDWNNGTQVRTNLIGIVNSIVPNVEGKSTVDWFNEQHVFDPPVTVVNNGLLYAASGPGYFNTKATVIPTLSLMEFYGSPADISSYTVKVKGKFGNYIDLASYTGTGLVNPVTTYRSPSRVKYEAVSYLSLFNNASTRATFMDPIFISKGGLLQVKLLPNGDESKAKTQYFPILPNTTNLMLRGIAAPRIVGAVTGRGDQAKVRKVGLDGWEETADIVNGVFVFGKDENTNQDGEYVIDVLQSGSVIATRHVNKVALGGGSWVDAWRPYVLLVDNSHASALVTSSNPAITGPVQYNSTVNLAWSSDNVSSCTFEDGTNGWRAQTWASTGGTFAAENLTATTNFILSCTAVDGTAVSSSYAVSVLPAPQPGSISMSGNGTPDSVTVTPQYNSVTVAWNLSHVVSCSPSGGDAGWASRAIDAAQPTGNYSTSVNASTTFNLTCIDELGQSIQHGLQVSFGAPESPPSLEKNANDLPEIMNGQTTVSVGGRTLHTGFSGNQVILNHSRDLTLGFYWDNLRPAIKLPDGSTGVDGQCAVKPPAIPSVFCFALVDKNQNPASRNGEFGIGNMTSKTFVKNPETNAFETPLLEMTALYLPSKFAVGDTYGYVGDFKTWGKSLAQSKDGTVSSNATWKLANYPTNIDSQSAYDQIEYKSNLEKIKTLAMESTTVPGSELSISDNWYLQGRDIPPGISGFTSDISNADANKYPDGKTWYLNSELIVPLLAGQPSRQIRYHGTGTLMVNGNFFIDKNVTLVPNDPMKDHLGIVVLNEPANRPGVTGIGNCTFAGNDTIEASIFCAEQFNVMSTAHNIDFKGSFVAKKFEINSSAANIHFYYRTDVSDNQPPGFKYLNIPMPKETK